MNKAIADAVVFSVNMDTDRGMREYDHPFHFNTLRRLKGTE